MNASKYRIRIIGRLGRPAAIVFAAAVFLAGAWRLSERRWPPHGVYGDTGSTISGLTPISTLHLDDLLVDVDVHDTTMASTGTNKKLTVSQLFGSPSTGNLIGWEGVPTPVVLGSGLSLTGSGPYTLSATGGGSGSGTVNSGTTNQLAYYASAGTAVSGLTLGSGLSITGGTISATGGSGSGTVNSGTANQLAYYSASGTAVSGLTLGTNLSISGGSLNAAGGGGTPGGSPGQIQYNNASAFGGASNLTVGAASNLNLAAQSAPGSPTVGDMWQDTTQRCLAAAEGASGAPIVGYLSSTLYVQNAQVTATAASNNSMMSATGATGTSTLPAGELNVQNKVIRVEWSAYVTSGSAPGNITFYVTLNGTAVATTAPIAMAASVSATTQGYIDLVVKTTGSGSNGKLDASGTVQSNNLFSSGYVRSINCATAIGSGTTAQASFDSTVSSPLIFGIAFSATGNSVTLQNLRIERKS